MTNPRYTGWERPRKPAGLRVAFAFIASMIAVVLSLLFSPVYAWVRRRRVPTPLALVIMLVGLTILAVGLFYILGVSISRFSADIASYTGKLYGQLGNSAREA